MSEQPSPAPDQPEAEKGHRSAFRALGETLHLIRGGQAADGEPLVRPNSSPEATAARDKRIEDLAERTGAPLSEIEGAEHLVASSDQVVASEEAVEHREAA